MGILKNIAAVIACVVVLAGHLLAEEPPPRDKVKIGAVLSLTGLFASYSLSVQQGINLALKDGSSNDFEVIFEDDQSINKIAAVSAAQKLVELDKAPIILNWVASTASAVAPVLAKSGAVGIIVWDSNQALIKLGDHIFGFGYSTEHAAALLAEFAAQKLKSKKLAVIIPSDEWAEVYGHAFVEKAKELGIEIVSNDSVTPSEKDFKTHIAKIKQKGADSMLAVLYGGGLVSWIKQSRQQAFAGNLLTADAVSELDLKEAGAASEGLYASQIWVDNPDFVRKYKENYGAGFELNMSFAALGYDTIHCLSEVYAALKTKNRPFTSHEIKAILPNFTCQGISGPFKIGADRMSDKIEKVVVARSGRLMPLP